MYSWPSAAHLRRPGRGAPGPQQGRAVAHPVVDVLVAVGVPLARAARALDVDGEGREVADVVGDAAGDRRARPLPERGRLRVPGAVLLEDRHGPPIIPERAASRSSSTTAAWASRGSASTVGSRRRVTPSWPPAATHAAVSRASSPGGCGRPRPLGRASAAATP